MKNIFFYFLFLFSCFSIQSQNKLADSLVTIVSQTTDKVEKLQLFNAISNAYKTSSGEQVITYGEKALQLAKELNIKNEEGSAYINLGNGNIILGNYDQAVNYFLKAKTVFLKLFWKKIQVTPLRKVSPELTEVLVLCHLSKVTIPEHFNTI